MSKREALFARAIRAGVGLQEREAQISELLSEARQGELDVSLILPRTQPSTRELSAKHLTSLAESISSLGVIEPIVVDAEHHLVAGLHRLAASRLLAEPVDRRLSAWMSFWAGSEHTPVMPQILSTHPPRTGIVPVHVLPIKSSEAPDKVLLIEIAENEKRRNYSHAEVRGFAERLKEAGYRYSTGRPREDEQALVPVLAATLGVSSRTVRRILSPGESVTRVLVPPAPLATRVRKALEAWLASGVSPRQAELGRMLIQELDLTARRMAAENSTRIKHYLTSTHDELIDDPEITST